MGNRHIESEPIRIINPKENPYLHIIKTTREDGTYGWDYVAHLSGLSLGLAKADRVKTDLQITHLIGIEIPLLPPIIATPPPPMDANEILTNAINSKTTDLTKALNEFPNANLLTFRHGYGWGLAPVKIASEILERTHRVDTNGVFQIGGRKKFQVNAVQIYSK